MGTKLLRKKLEALDQIVGHLFQNVDLFEDADKLVPLANEIISYFAASSDPAAKSLMLEFKALAWETVELIHVKGTFTAAKKVGIPFLEILGPLVSSATDPDLVRLQHRIAVCNFHLKEFQACEEQLKVLVPIFEKNEGGHFGPLALESAEKYFADVLQGLDKNEEALVIAQRTYERLTASSYAGPHHSLTLETGQLIAHLLFNMGKLAEAEESNDLVKEKLLIYFDHPETIDHHYIILAFKTAQLYLRLGGSEPLTSAFIIASLVYERTKNYGKNEALCLHNALGLWLVLGSCN